jgi:hypothetical protein
MRIARLRCGRPRMIAHEFHNWGKQMQNKLRVHLLGTALIMCALGFAGTPASAAIHLDGQVQAGGGPVAQSTVTLWAASANAPMHLGQAKTGTDGHFAISVDQSVGSDAILYLIASGGTPAVNEAGGNNPTLDLLAVLSGTPRPRWSSTNSPRSRPLSPLHDSSTGNRSPGIRLDYVSPQETYRTWSIRRLGDGARCCSIRSTAR